MGKTIIFFFLMTIIVPGWLDLVHAQKQGIIPRIGIVRAGAPRGGGAPDLFVEGLRSLGYIEGKNIAFEIRYAEGSRDRLRELQTELVPP